jgi:hypothetical protein
MSDLYCCLRRNEITVKGNYRNERKTKTEIGALFTFWYNDWQKKKKINRTKNEDELYFIQSIHLNIILKKRKK